MSVKTETFDDPFANLEFGEVEKATSRQVPEWDAPIPASIQAAVDRAISSGKRQFAPCNNIELRQRLHSASKAALALRKPELALHTRDEHDDDGNLVKFTFTVGQPRTRKPSTDSE